MEEWDNYGDTLEEPVSKNDFNSDLQVLLSFGGHTQSYTAGYAAVLKTMSGKGFNISPCAPFTKFNLHDVHP